MVEGETATEAEAPVPDRGTTCELPAALSEMLREADLLPLAAGVKVTLIAQLAPAATELPQLLDWAKSEAFVPRTLMLETFKATLPELLSVTI